MSKAVLLLTLCLMTLRASLGACPGASLLLPCTCEEKVSVSDVRCSGIESVAQLQGVIDATLDYRFQLFYLKDSYIAYLNTTWFSYKQTSALSLFNTTLVGLFDQEPQVTLPLMRELFLENSKLLRGLQWSHFRPFVQLRVLYLSGLEVKKLGKEFSEGVGPELTFLNLSDTKTSSLEEGVFSRKWLLQTVSVRKGSIQRLSNSLFEHQKASLVNVDFSYNPIESLPDDLFEGLRKLKTVLLNGARIKTLPKSLFQNFTGHLSVYENPVVCDCKLKWLSDRRYLKFRVEGTCDAPPTLKGKGLWELEQADFKACGNNALPFEH